MADASSPPTDPYTALPEPIKSIVTREEYLWLSDAQKANLEQELTEPEW